MENARQAAPTLGDEVKNALSEGSEVVFSFDTTGSMWPCIAAVRRDVEKTCKDLFGLFPGLKIGLIAHGDYCDGQKCMASLQLTDDREAVCRFVREAPNTGGGDSPECYEYALRIAQELGWTKGKAGKMLVLIGDDQPHPPDYPKNGVVPGDVTLDWRAEVDYLRGELGVKVFPVQCLFYQHRANENAFWAELAELAGTRLFQFAHGENLGRVSAPVFTGLVAAAHGTEGYARYAASPVGKEHLGWLSETAGGARVASGMLCAAAAFDPAPKIEVKKP